MLSHCFLVLCAVVQWGPYTSCSVGSKPVLGNLHPKAFILEWLSLLRWADRGELPLSPLFLGYLGSSWVLFSTLPVFSSASSDQPFIWPVVSSTLRMAASLLEALLLLPLPFTTLPREPGPFSAFLNIWSVLTLTSHWPCL